MSSPSPSLFGICLAQNDRHNTKKTLFVKWKGGHASVQADWSGIGEEKEGGNLCKSHKEKRNLIKTGHLGMLVLGQLKQSEHL